MENYLYNLYIFFFIFLSAQSTFYISIEIKTLDDCLRSVQLNETIYWKYNNIKFIKL